MAFRYVFLLLELELVVALPSIGGYPWALLKRYHVRCDRLQEDDACFVDPYDCLFFHPVLCSESSDTACRRDLLKACHEAYCDPNNYIRGKNMLGVALRAYLTTYVNLCWIIGRLMASDIFRGSFYRTNQWTYRTPFAIQWVWPVPILIGTIFGRESAW